MDTGGGAPGRLLSLIGRGLETVRSFRKAWKRFWSWRRIRFTRTGAFFTAGAFAVGFAAINTGNNLLYLLLGAMLGFIAVSSWLSEQVIGEIRVRRFTPRGVTVGNPLRIQYQVRNARKRIPAFALEIGEADLPGEAFLPFLAAGESTSARSRNHFVRRGVFPLDTVTVSTSFPFGLFRKSRSLHLPGEIVVWPRTDRRVRTPHPLQGHALRAGTLAQGGVGPRGEYRGLRGHRPGDDPKDIHWRTTARLGQPMIKEYEQNEAETLWLCLDTRGEADDRAEIAVEMVAALAARASHQGKRFGLTTPELTVEPGQGPGQLERVLTTLARVNFAPDGPVVVPPVTPRSCVLVSLAGPVRHDFGDILTPGFGDTLDQRPEGAGP